jgi:hypothetical protein
MNSVSRFLEDSLVIRSVLLRNFATQFHGGSAAVASSTTTTMTTELTGSICSVDHCCLAGSKRHVNLYLVFIKIKIDRDVKLMSTGSIGKDNVDQND